MRNSIAIVIALVVSTSTAVAQPIASATAPEQRLELTPPLGSSDPAREPQLLTGTSGWIKHHGWYAAPVAGITTMNHEVAPTFGLRGAWRINRSLGVGMTATGLELGASDDVDESFDSGYGGLLFEYVLDSNRVIHGLVDLTVGGGALCRDAENDRRCDDVQTFFVAEPIANVEFNVVSFMRIQAGAGYRFALAAERDGIGTEELSGFVGRVSLAFGQF